MPILALLPMLCIGEKPDCENTIVVKLTSLCRGLRYASYHVRFEEKVTSEFDKSEYTYLQSFIIVFYSVTIFGYSTQYRVRCDVY